MLVRLLGLAARGGPADEDLLRRFAADRDETAFAALVHRHGSMVLGVCRRILRDEHDAEDAFQQTFLALAQQAESVRNPASLANWLYGTAHRQASKARSVAARHRALELRTARPAAGPPFPTDWQDFQAVFDEELSRLPEVCRAAVVLCCLEGKTHAEAAAELGWPPGSTSRRLARARELLRAGLARRGVPVPVAWLIGCGPPLTAPVSQALAASTAASALAVLGVGAARFGGLSASLAARLALLGASLFGAGLIVGSTGALRLAPSPPAQAAVEVHPPKPLAADRPAQRPRAAINSRPEKHRSGFEGEQHGQHEDERGRKGRKAGRNGRGGFRGEQTGEHED
jgi:RNA polymerase sigma factor (sigma-70 family)